VSALTAGRNTRRRSGSLVSDPVAAATILYVGSMYALDASGHAVPAGTAGAGVARAIARVEADNRTGIAAALSVEGERTVAQYGNSAAADEITRTSIGALCYVVDDQTVAKTNGSGTRAAAGRIVDVDSQGVWVDVSAV